MLGEPFEAFDVRLQERNRPSRADCRSVSTNEPSGPAFAGSIPALYDRYLVPLIFDVYAVDLASRLAVLLGTTQSALLEVAAGTGAVTRQLAARLPDTVEITATDLSQPMIDHAAHVGTTRPVVWRQADVMALPFDDNSFGAVVCQFGVMFFPDRSAGFAEMRRVLRPGGVLVFNVWDRIEENEFAHIVTDAVAELFPEDPPVFMARIPHGYFDMAVVQSDLEAAGFSRPARFDTLEARSIAASAEIPAFALCQGTPFRTEIITRDASRLEEVTAYAAAAIARVFGSGVVDGKIRAHIITVEAP